VNKSTTCRAQKAQRIAPVANAGYQVTVLHQFVDYATLSDEPDAEMLAVSLWRIDMSSAQCAALIAPYESLGDTPAFVPTPS